mmetsp:Transcript_34007/g.67057  ORF Transcript_34007/g.67057 Transcript_34007/m.67057 type:complete len:226 (+) Transcript_34007:948-1625(+)
MRSSIFLENSSGSKSPSSSFSTAPSSKPGTSLPGWEGIDDVSSAAAVFFSDFLFFLVPRPETAIILSSLPFSSLRRAFFSLRSSSSFILRSSTFLSFRSSRAFLRLSSTLRYESTWAADDPRAYPTICPAAPSLPELSRSSNRKLYFDSKASIRSTESSLSDCISDDPFNLITSSPFPSSSSASSYLTLSTQRLLRRKSLRNASAFFPSSSFSPPPSIFSPSLPA